MRYLNRIIFINSAAIRYSEIQLDGNIHFIGTQVLASYIIQSYLEDNFAEFVKKVRRLGN